MITASPVRRVYYSEQTGYSVVVYKTNAPIPLQAFRNIVVQGPALKQRDGSSPIRRGCWQNWMGNGKKTGMAGRCR